METNRVPQIQDIKERDGDDPASTVMTPPPARKTNPLPVAILGAVVLLIGGLAFLAIGRSTLSSPVPAAQLQTAVPSAAAPLKETVVVTPTPAPTPCVSGQSQLAILEEQARVGKWQDAAETAEAALAVQGLCGDDRAILQQKAIIYGLDALYAQPVELEPFDRAAQQAQVDHYLKLRERARLLGIAFPSPLEVAREANASLSGTVVYVLKSPN